MQGGSPLVTTRLSEVRNTSFKNERELLDYVVEDIGLFVANVLSDELVSFEVEKRIGRANQFFGPARRVDLFVEGRNANYVIELKHPRHLVDNRKAIGQLLDYGRELAEYNPKLVLITTAMCPDTAKTIAYYELPITYIYLDKNQVSELRWAA
jgi:hypothetical protein